jgi:hypothetical protein
VFDNVLLMCEDVVPCAVMCDHVLLCVMMSVVMCDVFCYSMCDDVLLCVTMCCYV